MVIQLIICTFADTNSNGMSDIELVINKILLFLPFLENNERLKRLYLASESECLGHGGITSVSKATGMSRVTITEGIKEIHGELPASLEAGSTRERRSGAGRPGIAVSQPGIEDALLALVDKASYGNPENPLRWTVKSLRNLSDFSRRIEMEQY